MLSSVTELITIEATAPPLGGAQVTFNIQAVEAFHASHPLTKIEGHCLWTRHVLSGQKKVCTLSTKVHFAVTITSVSEILLDFVHK